MNRLRPPVCPTCLRSHWEIMSTAMAAHHAHMRNARFREAVKTGAGPRPWVHEVYAFPRYHVTEIDRWLSTTEVAA